MIDFDMLFSLFKIDPLACSIIFGIYLNTRTYGKRLVNVESRITILEGEKHGLPQAT
jgi:hypothetical protein